MTDAPAAVAVRGLHVTRGGAGILHGISLNIPSGSLYGLVGPSGSGKTTLIRAVVGRQRFTGEIGVLGRRAGEAALRPLIGYMPQSAAVYEDLTARENLRFFAAAYGASRRRVEEVLALVDLEDAAGRPVSTLSGGQRQRVALAAALLPQPSLLLLDEPTVGLDPRLRHRLWSQFRTWADSGATLVVSTHVMDEAAHVDRLAFLMDGRVVAEGAPAELLARTNAADLETAILHLSSVFPAGCD